MHMKKTIVMASVLLAMLLISLLAIPDHSNCRPFVMFGSEEKADLIIAGLINRLGGLPKSRLSLAIDQSHPQANIYSVTDWDIEAVAVGNTNTLLDSLMDDDPVYYYTIDFRTYYTDGSEELLRWSSWRYGIVVCPVVLLSGNGASGEIDLAH